MKPLAKRVVGHVLSSLPIPPARSGAPPRGWTTVKASVAGSGGVYRPVHAAGWAERPAPATTEPALHPAFAAALREERAETFVAGVPGGRVWGRNGAVLDQEHRLLWDVSREFGVDRPEGHSAFHQWRLTPVRRLPGRAVVLSAPGAAVYYHWMLDVLPRLALVEQTWALDTIDHFIVDHHARPFQTETLARLGIGEDRIVRSTDHWGFHVEPDELVVPSLPSALNRVAPWAAAWLRDALGPDRPADPPTRRLYLSRAQASGRRVLNEPEVVDVIREFGFEVVRPETMSMADQARLFQQAACVLGPHGSGFANVVHCRPGTDIVDLFAPTWVNPCFWTAAAAVGGRYTYTIEADGGGESQKTTDMIVDTERLQGLLPSLLETG